MASCSWPVYASQLGRMGWDDVGGYCHLPAGHDGAHEVPDAEER